MRKSAISSGGAKPRGAAGIARDISFEMESIE
jgi:hypothetical protein